MFDHPIHWAEAALLATGIILLVKLLIRLGRSHRFSEVLIIPPPQPNDLTPIDLWLVLLLYLVTPGLVARIFDYFVPGALPTTQPAMVEDTSTAQIAAGTVSMCITASGLLLIGRRPFKSFGAWGLNLRDVFRFAGPALLAYLMIWPICALLLYITTKISELVRI